MEEKRLKGGRIHRTKAQKIAVSEKIIDDFLDGNYTLESICKSHGVSPRTFRNWVRWPTQEEIEKGINRGFIAEVAALYEGSKRLAWDAQNMQLLDAAHLSLKRCIEGYYYEIEYKKVEMDEVTGEEVEKVVKRIKKYRPPSAKLIIWVLERLEPEHWSVTASLPNVKRECTCNNFRIPEIEQMSLEELIEFAKTLISENDE